MKSAALCGAIACLVLAACDGTPSKHEQEARCELEALKLYRDPDQSYTVIGHFVYTCMKANGYRLDLDRPKCKSLIDDSKADLVTLYKETECYISDDWVSRNLP